MLRFYASCCSKHSSILSALELVVSGGIMSEHSRLSSGPVSDTSKFVRNPAIKDDVYQSLLSELGGDTAVKRLENVMKKCENDY